MKGSDIDIMYVSSNVHVYEDINKVRLNSRETSCVMDMDDCNLGFTRLRLVQCNNDILKWCKQIGHSSYLSNELFKNYLISKFQQKGYPHHVHGPHIHNTRRFSRIKSDLINVFIPYNLQG
jgi:hypothetical protein